MRIAIEGLDQVIKKFGNYGKQVRREIDGEIEVAAAMWERLAKTTAAQIAHDQGFLMGKISKYKEREMVWIVVSAADYSAFVEWGTRLKTSVPAELQAYAAQFKGPTGRTGAREMIYAWCKRKGIEQKAWWFIYIQLMTQGANPHPFFFIHRGEVMNQLQKNINAVIRDLNERRA